MQKRYGLFTAISMVVGIVIGSGIFFKATKVLANNNGDMGRSLLTVGIVGAIMLICSFVFANLASRYEKVNGVVDYAEAALGRGYAYYVAWFMTLIYYPTITSTLGWVTSQYAAILFGFPVAGMTHYWVGFGILLADGLINAYAPRLAGKLQVSATVIKLIPLILMAVAGTITGLSNGLTVEAFTAASAQIASQGSGLMGAIVAFAFAYEGWIIATSINSELHNAKKNLPLALSLGALIVVIIYMAYFVGLTGSMSTAEMMAAGDMLPEKAFGNLFGPAAGTIVFVFIVISCLGTTNGLMMGCARGAYSLGVRGEGIAPRFFARVDKKTDMATNSAWFGIIIALLWYSYWHFFFIHGMGPSFFNWEPDELPIITLYADVYLGHGPFQGKQAPYAVHPAGGGHPGLLLYGVLCVCGIRHPGTVLPGLLCPGHGGWCAGAHYPVPAKIKTRIKGTAPRRSSPGLLFFAKYPSKLPCDTKKLLFRGAFFL